MAKKTRNLAAGLAMVMAAAVPSAHASQNEAAASVTPILPVQVMPRVRSDSPAIAALMLEAAARSVTFRNLVDTINASDGIVFVSEGNCGHGVRACLVHTVTMAGPNRLLRVVVDTKKVDWDLMGSMGHELRHAVEVLSNPTVTSDSALVFFYRRGSGGGVFGDRFETKAALRAGDRIREEARDPR